MAENTNNNKVMSQIERMQQMMNYGLQTESKSYRSVEHERKGADGNTYAIIREGSKYHIKVSDKKKPLKEDYQYIGGFQNHMENQYDSYGNALKHFDMKMSSLNEAYDVKSNVESWNINGRDEIIAEASDKMKLEIARIREIMGNTSVILEGKGEVCKDCKNEIEKKNINLGSATTGDAKNAGGDFYTEEPKGSDMENVGSYEDKNQKNEVKAKVGNKKNVNESIEENCETECGGIQECGSELNEDDLGDLGGDASADMGGDAPITEEDEFETEIDVEDTDDEGDEFEGSEGDIDLDLDGENDELETFSDEEDEVIDEPADEDPIEDESNDQIAELKAEIESLRSTIEAMADKMGVSEFDEDEPLYPEDEEDTEYELEVDDEDGDFEDEESFEDDVTFGDDEGDDFEEDEETTVYESRNYRQVMEEGKTADKIKKCVGKACKKVKEKMRDANWEAEHKPAYHSDDEEWNKYDKKKAAYDKRRKRERDEVEETVLHDFGKHPRFKKEPFTYPNPTMGKTVDGQWEAGDENSPSKGKKPYASTIGDPQPYGKGPKPKITPNSIAESIVKKILKNR